ncbi:uncharacterized protein [Solanum tuberosum]|uniref:Uncharacterized protein n=1 Tax=Solanum tuberosum TaxID=4113 RepID=M0ZHT5_SOLTU|nr:PREDICTED: uncharacterized protein LOC102592232 [Solanum tuberosum]
MKMLLNVFLDLKCNFRIHFKRFNLLKSQLPLMLTDAESYWWHLQPLAMVQFLLPSSIRVAMRHISSRMAPLVALQKEVYIQLLALAVGAPPNVGDAYSSKSQDHK